MYIDVCAENALSSDGKAELLWNNQPLKYDLIFYLYNGTKT